MSSFPTAQQTYYQELNKIYHAAQFTAEDYEQLQVAAKEIVQLANIARKEGLLALEEAAVMLDTEVSYQGSSLTDDELRQLGVDPADKKEPEKPKDVPLGAMLAKLILLIVDGTEPEIVEEIGLSYYYKNQYDNLSALIHLIYIMGVLSIQAGEAPFVLEAKMMAVVPSEVSVQLKDVAHTIITEYEQANEQTAEQLKQNMYHGDTQLTPEQDGYYMLKLLEYMFQHLDDTSIQRLLRDVENSHLSQAMAAMSGAARGRIFDNMSSRLGLMIAEDVRYHSYTSAEDFVDALKHILDAIITLWRRGEIYTPNQQQYEIIKSMLDVFKKDFELNQERRQQLSDDEKELARLVATFDKHDNYYKFDN